MANADIYFEEDRVWVAGRTWTTPYPIVDAQRGDERVFLIFDGRAGPSHRQFQNLRAFGVGGTEHWTADHPTSETADCYVQFLDDDASGSLLVRTFNGFTGRIERDTGRLLEAYFTR